MRSRSVRFSESARSDLLGIHDWISSVASWKTASAYIERLEHFCMALDLASERGTAREDVRGGLHVVGFERKISIAFRVTDHDVVILRIFRDGRDWESEFAKE
ncbi:type II toxin-antitoxin system RelE/ParE family toxin [Mesorhizobium xinjiangense]|uniref:type II toxin-antitoxin system RelE/ParE family toxin n=1 Tax=Mesorhizobium xinjiangense TaxID=2678685 RepID=UPI0012EDCA27|nr:type II toxin-antitoxin system RelE/ParE family toxin [Mesorhizobium xinjiangense]